MQRREHEPRERQRDRQRVRPLGLVGDLVESFAVEMLLQRVDELGFRHGVLRGISSTWTLTGPDVPIGPTPGAAGAIMAPK